MQQIERYGVIALILMLVTIVAVSLWDDSAEVDPDGVAALPELQQDPRNAPASNARTTLATDRTRPARRDDGSLPLSASQPGGLRANLRDERPANPRKEQPAPHANARQNAPLQPAKFEAPNVDPAALQKVAGGKDTTSPPARTGIQKETRRGGRNAGRNGRAQGGAAGKQQPAQQQPVAVTPPVRDVHVQPQAVPATYKVQSGDTLGHISLAVYETSRRWRDIEAANPGINPNRLIVGSTLKLPAAGATVAPARGETPKTPRPTMTEGRTYTVRPGDILGRIAQREVGSTKDIKAIAALNPGINIDRLEVGDVIALPERRQAPVGVPIEVARGARVAQADTRRAGAKSSDSYRVR